MLLVLETVFLLHLKMQKSKIFILSAVKNDLGHTKRLLKSIFAQTYTNYEAFIVDDGSTDGTDSYIKEKYSTVKLLKGNGDFWWTKSLNFGLTEILKKAGSDDYVWTINNDCHFDINLLKNLMVNEKLIKNPKHIVGSKIIDSNTKKVVDDGVKIDWKKMEFRSGGSDALSTKGTLYPICVFKKIGLFDAKHFPHYFSDYEFSIRAKREGFDLLTCEKSIIFNDTKRTGIEQIPKGLSLANIMNVAFSRKSKLNLITQLNIVRYVCPPEYRLRSYFLLISKLIHAKS